MGLRIVEYRVGSNTQSASLGSAIARAFLHDAASRVDLTYVGPHALNVSIKAIVSARRFMSEKGFDIIMVPGMGTFVAEGETMTRIVLQLYKTDANFHLSLVGDTK